MDIFINLPTSDLDRAKKFYTDLGWKINPLFSDENAAAIVLDEGKVLMLLKREFYATFVSDKQVGDPAVTSLALISFDLPSRAAVDEFAQRVESAGGTLSDAVDYGFMYQRAFDDPDGNHFEPFWMDPKAAEQGPGAV
ncbi:VOC family protein [Pseudoclavibacter sp. 13-3]|uniref:VOC family protein n=1 Tax=Pseudoclavibacter sp. 13-3 TaxID=2901228 RepID=UPI0022B23C01|nr:VOC family protein [Pseudoclavibacter sp. 13-3]